MSKVSGIFQNGKALVSFVTARDPNLEATKRLIPATAEAGADLIETGIPFSDSIAEGIVTQEADTWVLAPGTTTDKIFEMAKRIRERMDTPLAFMTHISPTFVYGAECPLVRRRECGINALIALDVLLEEKQEPPPYYHRYDIKLISLIAPASRERIAAIAGETEGLVYCISSMGVTGVRTETTTDIGEVASPMKKGSGVPYAIGSDISTPEQAGRMAVSANRVIVGSTIARIATQYDTGCIAPIYDYAKTMKAAIF